MRSCPRSADLRRALAEEVPLDTSLAAHVEMCADCARVLAAVRRFDRRLDVAMTGLVSDAPPPDTVVAARTARLPRVRRSPAAFMSTIATVALAAFAVVGAITAGSTLSDAVNGIRAGSSVPVAGEVTVGCRLGEAQAEVVTERLVDAAPVSQVVFCMGAQPETADAGGRGITCLVSESGAMPASSQPAVPDFLGACVEVERVSAMQEARRRSEEPVGANPVPMVSLRSWDDAVASAAWPVRRPAWLPDGYHLSALQRSDSRDGTSIDTVVAIYLRNGMPLTIEQFPVAHADAFGVDLSVTADEVDDVATGQTTVGGRLALWASGVVANTSGGGTLSLGQMMLAWSDGEVGYRLTARAVDLADLRRVATSLGGE